MLVKREEALKKPNQPNVKGWATEGVRLAWKTVKRAKCHRVELHDFALMNDLVTPLPTAEFCESVSK